MARGVAARPAAASKKRPPLDKEKQARKQARIKKRVDEARAQIASGIEAVRESDGMRAYLTALSRFHRYSANNNMLIHAQFPSAERVASETAWKKLGRTIISDQARHPIRILAPSFFIKTEVDEDTGEERKVRMNLPHRYTTSNVYDISQTEGKDLPPEPETERLEGSSDEAQDLVHTIARWCRQAQIRFRAEAGVEGGSRFDGDTILIDKDLPHNQRALLFAEEAARAAMTKEPALFSTFSGAERELCLQGAAFSIAKGCGLDADKATFPAMAKIAAGEDPLTADQRKSIERALKGVQVITHRVLGGEPQPEQ